MPTVISCTPPRKSTVIRIQMWSLVACPAIASTSSTSAPAPLKAATSSPKYAARLSGTSENEDSASTASLTSERYEAPRPCARPARAYSIGTCLNPTQATIPRRNRRRSGICFSASTTRRDISRKSPACPWYGTRATRCMSA
jgi:hypothetical protein